MSPTCNTPGVGQTGSGTPVKTLPLAHPSIEASTGQVEIKVVTSDQREIKGFATNQNDVKFPDQGNIKSLGSRSKYFCPDQGNIKGHTNDQKEIKGQVCCESNSSCDASNHHDHSKADQDDDDDFKPPKKKYRMVGVC